MPDPLAARTDLTARQATEAPEVFVRVFIFDFYDGPESGVAETPESAAYRFSDLGESRYRRHRAYLIEHLPAGLPPWARDRAGGFLSEAEWRECRALPRAKRYVAIGDLWLRCLVVDALSEDGVVPGTFIETHRALRSRFASAAGP